MISIEIEFGEMGDLGGTSSQNMSKFEVVLGVNGVAMDRQGLILWENEATGSGRFLDTSGASGTPYFN